MWTVNLDVADRHPNLYPDSPSYTMAISPQLFVGTCVQIGQFPQP